MIQLFEKLVISYNNKRLKKGSNESMNQSHISSASSNEHLNFSGLSRSSSNVSSSNNLYSSLHQSVIEANSVCKDILTAPNKSYFLPPVPREKI